MVMTSPRASDPNRRASRRWLDEQMRGGGVAAYLPMILPLLGGGLLLAQAGLLAHVLHRVVVAGDRLADVLLQVVLIATLLTCRILLGFASEIAAVRARETIKQKLRTALMRILLGRLHIWTASRSSGGLSTALVEQVDALDGYFVRYVPAMVQAAVLPLVFAAALFPIDWMVGLLLVITMPLIPLFMALAGWGAEAATARQAEALSRLGGRFADRLRGLTTLKLFGRAATETQAVTEASEELRIRTMGVMRIAFLS